MLFPTPSFAFFFFIVFIGFWYVFRKKLDKKIFLISASYLFYSFWDWRFCFFLLASTGANFGFGLLIGTHKEHLWRKTFLILSVIFNLLILGFFKYYTSLAQTANGLLSQYSSSAFRLPVLYLLLPIGISFITFKAMSYVFDVYLCKIPHTRSFLDLMLYVSFFPQLASGPIVHASDFLPQIDSVLTLGSDAHDKPIQFDRATLLILSGLIKKAVFANFISTLLVEPVFSQLDQVGTFLALFAGLAYAVLIYCDFSGYSDMAIGIALLLGFETPANFNRPYVSFSVTEFWKRWHISFSSWLKNYLYFSLGGSRFGPIRTSFALFFTMILGGLWHGASLTFLVWGALQGLALALERIFNYGTKRSTHPLRATAQILGTFVFVCLSWIIFRASNLTDVGSYFKAVFSFKKSAPLNSLAPEFFPLIGILIFLGLAMHAFPQKWRAACSKFYSYIPLPLKGLFIALTILLVSVVSMSGVAPFIYFSF